MSNISLGGNHGNSINFDGAVLQNQQEDEYRKEEEQQQNEVWIRERISPNKSTLGSKAIQGMQFFQNISSFWISFGV